VEDPELESISLFLTERELNNTILNGKIEAFSIRHHPMMPDIPECVPYIDTTTSFEQQINSELKCPSINMNTNNDITTTNTTTTNTNNNNNHENIIDDITSNLINYPKPRSRSNSCTSDITSLGRPKDVKRSSSLGDLNTPSSKQLFLNLITTLNESFPDYDFQSTKLDQFIEMDVFSTMRSINSSLVEITEIFPNFLEKLWHSIDQCVSLRKNTTVFSYVSDNESDPFSQVGALWSFNYFFFNAQKMKICFFTCVARR
jgi:hypothetical protein